MKKIFSRVLLASFILIFPLLISAASSNLDPTFSTAELAYTARGNTVAVQPDGKIIVGGEFDSVNGAEKRNLVRLNTDGSLDASFNLNGNGTNRQVLIVKLQTDRKILIGGDFTTYNGAARNGIARLNADGSLDETFQPNNTGSSVRNIEIQTDGKILAGGRNYLRRLNVDGSRDTTFRDDLFWSDLRFTLLPDGKIAAATEFGEGFRVIWRLNPNGSGDLSYQNSTIAATALRALPDGRLLVGSFTGIFRFNADGTRDFSFPNSGGFVSKIDLTADGKILVGYLNNQNIVRLLPDGVIDPTFSAALNIGGVNNLAVQADGKIILVGNPKILPSPAVPRSIVRLNADGSLDSSFDAIFAIQSANVRNVGQIASQPNGKIYVIADYQATDGTIKRGLLRLNNDGSRDATFAPFAGVYAFAQQTDGKIVVIGNSSPTNSTVVLVRLNTDGTLDNSFNAVFNGDSGRVYDLAIQPSGKILLVGDWTTSGSRRRNVARLNVDGSEDSTFVYGDFSIGFYRVFSLPNNQFFVAGDIILARYNADGTRDTNFQGAVGLVNDIVVQPDGKILAGGEFSRYLVRLNFDGTIDSSFNPSFDYVVRRIALQRDGKILAAGDFTFVNGVTRSRLVRLNNDGSLDAEFNPLIVVPTIINDIEIQADGKILLGGDVLNLYNTTRFGVVRLLNASSPTLFDYDGDGKSDISVFRLSSGAWFINQSQNGLAGVSFGFGTDKIVPADYDGDGKTDVAVYRPSSGTWYINRSQLGFTGIAFGAAEDVPVPADYDADGKADIAVFRPSNGTWYINRSQLGLTGVQFGQSGDRPVPADFDGDGKTDIAVYRNGVWYIERSRDHFISYQFGIATDKPVPADYDADGKADIAVYRNGIWYLERSRDHFVFVQFGATTDIPVPADYDADGKTDIAVYRPSNGVWYLNRSGSGLIGIQFGISDDIPTANAFIR